MFYLVMEIQAGDTVGNIVTSFTERNLAEQTYHTVLAAAAVSNVKTHTAILMKEDGTVLARETYRHNNESEPEEI